MAKLNVFNFTTLNGFYKGTNEDISWHRHGAEEGKFSEEGAQSGGILLFGRVTYEMMAGFWPTEQAKEMFPIVADGMNKAEKIVFSHTINKADWQNTRIVRDNMIEEINKLKQGDKDMTILGSGSIITQCAEQGLIDTYQIMIDPVAIGEGKPMFFGMQHKLELELIGNRVFNSGVVLLTYRPK